MSRGAEAENLISHCRSWCQEHIEETDTCTTKPIHLPGMRTSVWVSRTRGQRPTLVISTSGGTTEVIIDVG